MAVHGIFRNTLTGAPRAMPGDGTQPADIATLACDATFTLKPDGGFDPSPSNAGASVNSDTVTVTAITNTTDANAIATLLNTVAAIPTPLAPNVRWTVTYAALLAASAGSRIVLTVY